MCSGCKSIQKCLYTSIPTPHILVETIIRSSSLVFGGHSEDVLVVSTSYVASGDETDILREGYWASYNIPFFEEVYNMSGYPAVAQKEGPDATYQLCPRAKIFRRDQSNVKDMESMQYIMRYNGENYSGTPPLNN